MRTPVAALAALLALAVPAGARADAGVVVTIKPLHSLVAGVMEGVGTPDLMIPGTISPHSFSLKPSDARALEQARVVFWIGPELESPLERSIATLSGKGNAQSMMTVPGVTHRAYEDGHDDRHGHEAGHKDGHDHKHGKDEHAHDHGDDKHGKDDRAGHAHTGHDHSGHDHGGHDHGSDDAHIWLDPDNARAMVAAIATTLSGALPDHADTFAANAARIDGELAALVTEVGAIVDPVRATPFLTFHDAFGHFEDRFGLTGGEAISVNPEVKPGAGRIAELREEITEEGFACVFIEPQFSPAIAEVIVEGTGTRIATLDPLGSTLEGGPALYPALIRGLATTLRDCMAG
ncbi:MAG: zinc ABC transporter substrate-binding protein [Thalassobaculaceae bacterium]